MSYEVEKRGKKFMVVEIEGEERKDLKEFSARSASELFVKRLEREKAQAANIEKSINTPLGSTTANPTGETPLTEQKEEKKPEKKLSGTDFVMYYILEHPEASKEQIRGALNKAELKMADSMLDTWPPFMAKIIKKLDELGWTRPNA